MKPVRIELADFSEKNVGVLAGQEAGREVRRKFQLDRLDAISSGEVPDGAITIVIPEYVYSFNSSYFLGMLAPSVTSLGAEEFRRRYRLEGPGASDVLERGIRVSQLTRRPLKGFGSRETRE